MPHDNLAESSPRNLQNLPRQLRILIFRVADRSFALPVAAVQEIVPFVKLSQPPGLPPAIAGFLQLGGTNLPVLRLANLFGLPEVAPGLYTPLLILHSTAGPLAPGTTGAETAALAVWVDVVDRIAVADEAALVPLHAGYTCIEGVRGMLLLGTEQVLLLESARLSSAERELRAARIATATSGSQRTPQEAVL